MMLGAEGVWVGSAFLASNEAGIQAFQKQAIVDASEDGTVEPLPMPYQGAVSGPVLAAATRDKRGDVNPGFAGQGIGLIKSVRPAAEIFKELVWGAEQALKRSSNWVLRTWRKSITTFARR